MTTQFSLDRHTKLLSCFSSFECSGTSLACMINYPKSHCLSKEWEFDRFISNPNQEFRRGTLKDNRYFMTILLEIDCIQILLSSVARNTYFIMIHNLVCNKEDNEYYYRKRVVRRARFELFSELLTNIDCCY